MNDLMIADMAIRQVDGLYCLNDLHRASGGVSKYQPAFFMRLDGTKDMIEAISNSADLQIKPTEIKEGRGGGTYVCEDLVYDYAMWISAEFKLMCIRAVRAMKEGKHITVHPPHPQMTVVDEGMITRISTNVVQSVVPPIIKALGDMFGSKLDGLYHKINVIDERSRRQTRDLEKLTNEKHTARRGFTKATKYIWGQIVKKYYSCKCPGCLKVQICDTSGNLFPGDIVNYDHAKEKHLHGLFDGLPLCLTCHGKKTNDKTGYHSEIILVVFPNWIRNIEKHQGKKAVVPFANPKQGKLF